MQGIEEKHLSLVFKGMFPFSSLPSHTNAHNTSVSYAFSAF